MTRERFHPSWIPPSSKNYNKKAHCLVLAQWAFEYVETRSSFIRERPTL